uniref:Sacsin-like n=1 Tax=Saccoglossus kowalevskii TaxID=10224 RepID=A0ABM0M6G4_SACKO|nr:PREDICTED: sacsin-like [Saccoglossus kowalevskii]
MDSSDSDEDFGQEVPPLYLYLKRILDKYPEGGQILKEIIQNADDAGATEVKFLYDNTEYPTDGLWSDKLKEFHGPALYAYNNAVFEDKDWWNIQRPEQSGKADDPLKVGRFGLGFNSVYHITDLPSILSGKYLGVFDPLEKVFAYDQFKNKHYHQKPGKKWKLKGELLSNDHTPYSNQFEPYLGIFGCDESSFQRGKFNGTIFRFPLRKTESQLSGNIISRDRIMGPDGWITLFRTDVDLTLLFLKNIESISVYERNGQNAKSILLYSASIVKPIIDRVRTQKSAFLDLVKTKKVADPISIDMEIKLEDQIKEEVKRWVVVHQIPSSVLSKELSCLADDEEIRLLPWVGAAMQISNSMSEYGGRIFCFLPLPPSQTTGLPVHIHGYFGLGDNRRSIKWPDMESQQDKTARWNQLLTSEAIPEVYVKLITSLIHEYKLEPKCVYAAWPDPCKITSDNWKWLLEKLLKLLLENDVFYTEANSGTWIGLKTAIFNTSQNSVSSIVNQDVVKLLLDHGQPIVNLPMHILEWLKVSNAALNILMPASVRRFLKSIWHQNLERRTKLNILEYILTDAQYNDLNGLHLLPLANGTFTSFSSVGDSKKVFIATQSCPQYLLPNMDNRFLDGSLPHLLKSKLEDASKYTQLSVLNPDIVAQNLRSALPSKWTAGLESTIMWSQVRSDQYPPPEWLSQFWNWFICQKQLSITVLESLPLIPLKNCSSTIELLKLKSGPKAIFRGTLPEDIVRVVEMCSGFVIHEQPYLQRLPLKKYIASSDADGVLTVFENIGIGVVQQKLKSNPVLANSLCTFLAQQNGYVCDKHRHTLKQLPIFGTIMGSTCISVNECALIAPSEYNDIPCNKIKKQTLTGGDINTLNLAKALGAKQLRFDEYLENYILCEVENQYFSYQEVTQIMEWVLNCPQYDYIVKKYRCIQSRGGQLSKPCEIIDPDNSLLKVLLGESGLPVDTYIQPKLIKLIRRVGLMEESNVSPDIIYSIAKNLDCQRRKCTPDTMQKAHCLLKYVNKYSNKLNTYTNDRGNIKLLLDRLKSLAWLPCEVNRPKDYPSFIPWFGDDDVQHSRCLFTPREITSHDHYKKIGGVMPIIPVQHQNHSLFHAFQWQTLDGMKSYDHVQKVVMQMKLIVDSAEEVVQNMLKPLEDMIFEIYSFLSKSNIEWVRHWINVNGGNTLKWIWHGRGFTSANNVAFASNLHINLQPYLFTLPLTLAEEHSQLFKEMHISKEFNPRALTDVLHRIKKKHCGTISSKDVETDLKLSCEIIHLLCKDSILKDDIQKSILVPAKMHDTSKLQLVEVNLCLYRDREFLPDDLTDNSFYIVHDDIPNVTARKLGLQPLSNHVAPTDNLGYDLAGPHESVINAIKRNLEMYKEGVDIFKELIQNADDADATEIRFLIDQRQNVDLQLKLLDPGMKHCHGPALWSYNDAMFSSEDIKNICDIAAASKKDKLDKIGRFGLGFTSVYHVTDVPSVVSGSHIMIFDPRMTHLKSRIHNPSQPGIKLNLQEESHQQTLSVCVDQFQPYHEIFGCNISEDFKFNGTLFRLPLRNHYQASDQMENRITDAVYDDKQKLQKLISQLKESAPSLLLFTQNVKKLSIWELKTGSKSGAEAVKMLTIEVNLTQQLPRQIASVSKCPVIDQLRQQSNILNATSKWVNSGHDNPPESTSLIEVVFESQLSKSMKTRRQKDIWLVSSCASMGAAFKAAQQDDGRKQGVLPCGGVAAQLKTGVNGLNPLPLEGQLYSFLPVTIQTGLPIHLNAPFALQPNRRHIWSKSSVSRRNTEFEGEWNLCLLIDVLGKAFINLLTDMIQLQINGTVGRHDFHTLWPNLESTESDFHPFVRAFYESLSGNHASGPPQVIYNESQWVTLNECLFLGTDLQQETQIVKYATIILNEYCKPKRVVKLNEAIEKCIKEFGTGQVIQENVYDITRFYKDVFFKYTEDISLDIKNPLLLYLLDIRIGSQKDVRFDKYLKEIPCFPVTPDGYIVDVPHNLVHPESLVGNLFDDSDGRFPYGDGFLSKERLLSLIDLGMATDELSWEDLLGRAQSVMEVCQTHGFKAAVLRTKVILKVMNNLLKQGKSPSLYDVKRLTRTSFLPVLKKPDDYPCDWMGEENFADGASLFSKGCVYHLGSVAQILDDSCIDSSGDLSQEIMKILGVKNSAPIDNVLLQLQHVLKYPKAKKTMIMCSEIYQYLQQVLCEEVTTNSGNTSIQIRAGHEKNIEELQSLKVFFVDDMFVGANQLAFKWTEVAAPYLYKVPKNLMKCKKLLQVCGVRESFDNDDYLDVLTKLKERHGNGSLPEQDLRLALIMLNTLDSSDDFYEITNLYAPDTETILRNVKDLTFDDAPWLINKAQFIYAHHAINWKQADKFGIIAARKKRSNEFSLPLGCAQRFDTDVRNMMDRFKDEACKCLLFLTNVEVITLSEILKTGEIKQLYKAEAKLFGDSKLRREDIATHMLNHKKMNVTDIPLKLVDYNLQICDSRNKNEEWLVVQQFGFHNSPDIDLAGEEELGKLLPRVGVAALVEDCKAAQKYNSFSPSFVKSELKRSFNAYCFLPLPITTDLPVHVNGHFALDRSRRYIWSDIGTHQTVRSIWNKLLIEHALAPAYANLIMLAGQRYVTATVQDKLEWYHNLFPSYSSENKTAAGVSWASKGIWRHLSAKTLQVMSTDAMHVLPLVRQRGSHMELTWHEPLNEDDQVYFNCFEKHEDLETFLLNAGMKLITSTIKIYNSFHYADVAVKKVNPVDVVTFMRSDKCHIGSLPCSIVDTTYCNANIFKKVLHYILDGLEHPNSLDGLPLLLRGDHYIDEFHPHNAHFLTWYADLLPGLKDKFISNEVTKILVEFERKKSGDSVTTVWADFTPQDLCRYIDTVLPVKWFDVRQHVNLDSESETIMAWMALLWRYLCSREDKDVIEPIQQWPIIPTSKGMFVSPSQGKTVLSLSKYEESLSLQSKVIDFLRKVGCPEVKFDLLDKDKATSLSKVKFIKAADGSMQSADYFFHGRNEVFKMMVEKRRLLPDSFIAYKWSDFLIKLGVNDTVTQDLFLEYANEVASEALRLRSCDMTVVLEKSRTLARELSVNESLHYPSFLKEVSTIKYIPPVPIRGELLEIYPLENESAMFICLKGNVSSRHMKLSWSNSSLLPDWAIPKKRSHIPRNNEAINLHECLGILDKPSVDTVINHCQNVCHHLAGKNSAEKQHTIPKIRKLLAKVLEDVYDFLTDYQNKPHLMSRLHNTPLVLVDQHKVLVRANQLAYKFDHLGEDDLQPYMYVPPRSFGKYEGFLKSLGAEESATFRQYSDVLSKIHSKCEDRVMLPTEKDRAMKATKGLFYYLYEHKQMTCDVSKLYLPTTRDQLKLSSDLFYGSRSLLYRIDTDKYEFAVPLRDCDCHADMNIDLLPENLRPKNISKFVVAKVDPQCKCCIAGESCPMLEYVEKRMKSTEFAQCILRLVHHQTKKCDENQITMMKEKIQICCMTDLKTKLFNQKQNTYIEGSEKALMTFLEDKQKLYISHSDTPFDLKLFQRVAAAVNKMISYQLKDPSIIHILLSSDIESFHDLLTNDFEIPELQNQIEAIQENKHSPGKNVPMDIHHLLDDDPINIFRKGEIVALRRSIEVDENDRDIYDYIFAKITQVISSDAEDELGLSTKYKIDDGSCDEKVVSGIDLYKFLRPNPPTGQAVVSHSNQTNSSDASSQDIKLEEAKDIIKKTLCEAFNMPKVECDKIVRRLYKRWHPDKNPKNPVLATAAFQYLRQKLEIRESGGTTGESYRRQYNRWDAEARNQRSQSEQYHREYGRHYRSGRFSESNIPPSFNRSTPKPREARVWFKQAECDLQAALVNIKSINPSAEWVCFQVHQAAEKALKAAKFATDGDPVLNCTNLTSLMHAVQSHPDCPPDVEEDVAELVQNRCDFSNTRYPQRLMTPNERYNICEAKDAVKCAQRLLDKMKQFIGIRRF